VTGGLALQVDETIDDYSKHVHPTEFLTCLETLGVAYAVCEVVPKLGWEAYIDTIKEKISQFPHPHLLANLMLCDHRLRQKWGTYLTIQLSGGTPCTLPDAIAYYQTPAVASPFWMEALFVDPTTRMPLGGSSKGKGKGSDKGGYGDFRPSPKANGRNKQRGPYEQPKQTQPPRQGKGPGAAGGRPGKGPRVSREVAANFGYHGPLRFNQDGFQFCFRGSSIAGCPQGPGCKFAASHGMCPLPKCNKAKHSCEQTHPELWAPFASALASSPRKGA